MMETYPYLASLGVRGSELVYRSSLQIEIRGHGKHITQMAIVDSGSDVTLMHSDIAHFIGIDTKACRNVNLGGITGNSTGYQSEVSIVVERFEEAITIPVVFTNELNTGILLGQIGFFEAYKVTFDRKELTFTLEKNVS